MAITPRGLHHQKAFRIIIGKGVPVTGEGSDGDMQLRSTNSGLMLYVKYGGQWYQMGEGASRIRGEEGGNPVATPQYGGNTFIDKTKGHLYIGGNIVLGGKRHLPTINGQSSGMALDPDINPKTNMGLTSRLLNYTGGNDKGLTALSSDAPYVKGVSMLVEQTHGIIFDGDSNSHTNIKETGDDVLTFQVGGDNMFILDEATDKITHAATNHVIALADGTQFSVANSAYAGMILGYRCIGEDASADVYAITATYAVPDSNMTVRFIAPPSGKVEVMVQVHVDSVTALRTLFLGLSDNATYNSIGDQYEQFSLLSDETDDLLHTHRWTVTGLTAGNTYNYWLGAKVSSGSKNLRWGGNSADEYGSFVMKVTALPQATVAFAQYG